MCDADPHPIHAAEASQEILSINDRWPGPIYTYSYDDAYRLTHSQRQAGMTTSNTYYTLDGTNNRRLVYSVLSFPPPPDNYVLDETVPPADEQMNQYTETPFDERTGRRRGSTLDT